MVIYAEDQNRHVPSLSLGSKRIEYVVTKGMGRKYTYFRFLPDLTLQVIVPSGRRVDVEEEITARRVWLEREHDRLARTKSVLTPNTVMYGGEYLKFVTSPGIGEKLSPDPGRGEVLAPADDPRLIKELVRRWFLTESSAYAVRRTAELAPRVGARPSAVDVREIGKWGYCTRTGRISFSWQLVALSERLREYVVLHELTHLREFNHSDAFRKRLSSVCPDFRERERELEFVAPYDRLAPP